METETALETPAPTHTPKYKRTNPEQRAIMRELTKLNTPQVEIARVLGVTQPTVSKWLAELLPTTDDANEYFRAKALPMAKKVVQKGKPSDLIKVLEGIDVLSSSDKAGGVTINVGGDAQIALLNGKLER